MKSSELDEEVWLSLQEYGSLSGFAQDQDQKEWVVLPSNPKMKAGDTVVKLSLAQFNV